MTYGQGNVWERRGRACEWRRARAARLVEQVRHDNDEDFGPSARRAVERTLSAGQSAPVGLRLRIGTERHRRGGSTNLLAGQR